MRTWMLLAWLIASMGAQAQKIPDVQTFTLRNGMKFLVLEDFSIPNANMYIFYKVGSRNEHPGITGLSHFFEHMMFNGSKKYGPKQFDRVMEFNGGANNAYTTEDVTVYTNWFPASAMETIFDLEADRISSLSIDSGMVESERGVVLSERSTGLENSPWRLLLENVQATAFQEGPYHWPVIGYEQDIKNWTKADLERYFRTYYAPNNAVTVISGAVKTADVKRLAEKYLEAIPAQPAPKPVHLLEAPQIGERRIAVQKEVATPYLSIAYHTPASNDSDYYALKVLEAVLASGNSSRLYASLVDRQQLATSVFVYFGESFDPGLFSINAVVNEGVQPEALEKAVYAEIQKVQNEGIGAAELQKIKNQKLVELYLQLETINGKSNNLGTYEVYFGNYQKLFDAPEAYNKLTVTDIQKVAQKYFRKSNRTVGVLQTSVE
jgi:zinc protease